MACLRLDLLHPGISGNKWYKLKYNLAAAEEAGQDTILTFGGAFSNHIAATAFACKARGLKAVGVIRGEEPQALSHTLREARQNGMILHFATRKEYRGKEKESFIAGLRSRFGNIFIIPEGGNNELGIKGAEEILENAGPGLSAFTHLCCAAGTGATLAGLIRAARPHQTILGFPALKNAAFLKKKIATDRVVASSRVNWEIIAGYEFGGYAKHPSQVISFMNRFYEDFNIPLDFVYTGKMAFGVMDLADRNYFPPGSNILLIHTGGLQGNHSLPNGTLIF